MKNEEEKKLRRSDVFSDEGGKKRKRDNDEEKEEEDSSKFSRINSFLSSCYYPGQQPPFQEELSRSPIKRGSSNSGSAKFLIDIVS